MIRREEAEGVASQMALYQEYPEIQVAQTYYRMQLVEGWQIPAGARVLEIGCGQGDMTAALAHAVGSSGYVTAVDIAPAECGAPISLGGSMDYLQSTPLGQRIEIHFQYDLLDTSIAFPAETFDYVVLAHCSWYFASLEHLRRVLLRVKPWARRLCFSEWDLEPCTLEQVAHLLAVLIQGQAAAYNTESAGNVRTPFSRTRLKQLLRETGWDVSTECLVDATQLKDGEWEVANCLHFSLTEAATAQMPEKLRELLGSQVDTLRLIAEKGPNHSLSAYSMMAERSG